MMGFFDAAGAKVQQSRATIVAALAFTVLGFGLFFAGIWAASTGTLTFGTETVSTNAAPAAHGPDEMCCDKPMAMNNDHKAPKSQMPADMPMDKPATKPGMDCCDK